MFLTRNSIRQGCTVRRTAILFLLAVARCELAQVHRMIFDFFGERVELEASLIIKPSYDFVSLFIPHI